jgi:hypothetical protein
MLPTAMVVGIGYGTEDLAAFHRMRTADMAPPPDDEGRKGYAPLMAVLGDKSGGADALLTFLTDTLAPEIARRYPRASTTRQALFGHSLGGLFAAYALLTRPEAFAAYLIGSPALNWNNSLIRSLLPAVAGRVGALARKPRALIGVGGKEQDLPTELPPGVTMSIDELHAMVKAYRVIDASSELAAALGGAGLDDVAFVNFAGEDHITVLAPLLMRSIAFFCTQGDRHE